MPFIWILLSILLVGFFTGIYTAFVNVNRLTVELKKKQGRTGGILLAHFFDDPGKYIGITLIGYTIFLVMYGLLIGQMLGPLWEWLITKQHIPSGYVNFIHLLFEVISSTFLLIVFGEFIPRAFWKSKSDLLLNSFVAQIVQFFYTLLEPVAAFFVYLSEWILKYLFNIRVDIKKDSFVRADLEHFFQQTREQDIDGQDLNAELFENALSLPNVKVRQCLIPRKEIEGIEINTSIEQAKHKFIDTKLSKLVVFENNIDHVIGYIHQLHLFKKPSDVRSILLPIPAVPESMSVTDLINLFSKERKSIAWVVDEFGGTSGIVTMEDLLEEIFGEIKDEYDTEEFEDKKLNDEEYLLSGRLELDYLNEKYGLEFPENESETLSGFIIHQHETIPKVKERIIIGNYEFDIIAVGNTRIDMVRMKILK